MMDPDAPIDVPEMLSSDPGVDVLGTYWPSILLLLPAAALVFLAVRSARRRTTRSGAPRSRPRRILTAASWSTGTAMILAVALALGVNTWVGYFPSVAALARWTDGRIRQPVVNFPQTAVDGSGAAAGAPAQGAERVTTSAKGYSFLTALPSQTPGVPNTGAWVYLPPDYDAAGNTTRYPVIYALHGSPGSAADWFAGGRIDYLLDTMIASGHVPPMIVVAPDLNAGSTRVDDEPLNRPGGPQLEDFVTRGVVGWADANLRTSPEARNRIISGMSSGGLASLLGGLRNPELFGGVVSIMPYTKPYTREIVADEAALRRNSPLEVIAARPGATDQKIFLGQGGNESSVEATQIRDALRAQGQTTRLLVIPKLDHNWVTARAVMPYGLVWVFTQLGWTRPAG